MNTLFTFLITTAATIAAPQLTQADIAWIAEGEFCQPETVLALPDDTLLISNVCDFRKAGSGFLTLLSAEGKIINWRVVDGLDSPLGMARIGDRLHVVDNNQVKVFRWPGYQPIESFALDTTVANDIAVAADGTIYVTDTARHQVIKRTPQGQQSVLGGKPEFYGANGIEIDGDTLYVGGKHLWLVDLKSDSVTILGPEWLTDIDGIELEPDGTVQITPVGGPLIRFRSDTDIEVLAGEGVSSANHGYSESLDLALIPTGYDNIVIAIRIPASRGKKK